MRFWFLLLRPNATDSDGGTGGQAGGGGNRRRERKMNRGSEQDMSYWPWKESNVVARSGFY